MNGGGKKNQQSRVSGPSTGPSVVPRAIPWGIMNNKNYWPRLIDLPGGHTLSPNWSSRLDYDTGLVVVDCDISISRKPVVFKLWPATMPSQHQDQLKHERMVALRLSASTSRVVRCVYPHVEFQDLRGETHEGFVLEHCETDLLTFIRQEPRTVTTKQLIMTELLKACMECHAVNIPHGNLTPQAVALLSSRDELQVKLRGFAYSGSMSESCSSSSAADLGSWDSAKATSHSDSHSDSMKQDLWALGW